MLPHEGIADIREIIITKSQLVSLGKNTILIATIFVGLFLLVASIPITDVNLNTTSTSGEATSNDMVVEDNNKILTVQNDVVEDQPPSTAVERVADSIAQRLPDEITPWTIFFNNIRIVLFSSYLYPISLITTSMTAAIAGLSFNVFASIAGARGQDAALLALTRPFFWLEITAYCLAAAQSIHLTKTLRGSVGVKDMILLSLRQIRDIFRKSTWKRNWSGKKSVSRKVYILRVLFHIDLLSIDRVELRRQLIITALVIAFSSLLLAIGAIEEMRDIDSMIFSGL